MISIIVPAYQSESTIKDCLDSLTGQSFSDIEILVVDDGSEDRTAEIAEKCAKYDKRIHVFHQENAGVSAARNSGIRAARGELIQFLDSDDTLLPDACEVLYQAMQDSGADLVIAGYIHEFYGKMIQKQPPFHGAYEMKNAEPELLSLYREGYLNMPWNKLYKKEMILQDFPEDWKLGEDLIFNLNYLKQCKQLSVISQPVCSYVQDNRGTNLSAAGMAQSRDHVLTLYQKVTEFFHYFYHEGSYEKTIAGKVIEEFLNQISESAFGKTVFGKAPLGQKRISLLQEYIEAYKEFEKIREENGHMIKIDREDLIYPDHRMMFGSLKKGYPALLAILSWSRALIVKVSRSRIWK
ncbi:MAG: glycosyltransferase family 2 protein [Lachnospiraceae bacterium]|nr:glycosyltransferase family 2 protein [Lachnospiraceae bacterium]